MVILKRDGTEVPFDESKIVNAIMKANNDVLEKDRISEEKIKEIADNIKDAISNAGYTVNVEEIQNMVEDGINENKKFTLGRAYSQYRFKRAQLRIKNTTDDAILSLINYENEEVKQENSNKNPEISSVQRDYMAGEVSKDLTKRFLLADDIVKAHEEGIIHFHDADYFAQKMHNCIDGNSFIHYKGSNGIPRIITLNHLLDIYQIEPYKTVYRPTDNCMILSKDGEWTKIRCIMPRYTKTDEMMYVFRTESGKELKATGEHIIPVIRDDKEEEIMVKDVLGSDMLLVHGASGRNYTEEIVSMESYPTTEKIVVFDLETDNHYFCVNDIVVHNCGLVNLKDMLDNGTVISNVLVETPHRFTTACNITTQIMAQVASSQYGGQSMTLSHLAPYVDKSRQEIRADVLDDFGYSSYEELPEDQKENFDRIVEKRVRNTIKEGVQIIQYQVSTLMTTNGQAPFITLFMYINELEDGQTKDDLVLIIKEVLRQRYKGVKNEKGVYITPAFPKLIYVLDEDNVYPGTKYYEITKMAAKCTARRMVPDYISAKVMKEIKDGSVYTCMGCVTGADTIIWKDEKDDELRLTSFRNFYDYCSKNFEEKDQEEGSPHKYIDLSGISIYDQKKGMVTCKRVIKNKSSNWLEIGLTGRVIRCTPDHPFYTENRGRVYAKDLMGMDRIPFDIDPMKDEKYDVPKETATRIGELWFSLKDEDIKELSKLSKGIHNFISWNKESKLHFLSGVINTYGTYERGAFILIIPNMGTELLNRENLQMLLEIALSCGIDAKADYYSDSRSGLPEYYNNFVLSGLFLNKDDAKVAFGSDDIQMPLTTRQTSSTVLYVKEYLFDDYSYDVTTESDFFTVSGIYSHNCRSFLTVEDHIRDENGNRKFYGRFNQGVVTINLPDVALSSGGDREKFWEILDERLELCHRALRARHERLLGTPSDIAPIIWQHGGYARLKKGETIDKLLFGGYSTISLGYAGLYETTKYMTGESHTHEGDPKEFALAVMQKLNDKCAQWRAAENIAYSVYGTPLESTTYKFAKALKRRFGVIKDITDHGYITNSYHCSVREEISAFDKLAFESEFQKLSPGGAISYVEAPNLENNIDAVLKVMQFIYENITYAELNTKSDYCHVCGTHENMQIITDEKTQKLIWECPNCGNRDQNKMNVARRTCGLTNYSPR